MAVCLLEHEVSDICIGKPALRSSLPISASVADALSVLKIFGESSLSVWTCNCVASTKNDHEDASRRTKKIVGIEDCRCVGKVCMVDVVCFLCEENNLNCPESALQSSISVLLTKAFKTLVAQLQPNSRLLEAIDLILEGAQNLVVPIHSPISKINSRRKLLSTPSSLDSTIHNGREYCWLTQEDVLRFILNSIAIFSPIPTFTIQSLYIIQPVEGLTVHYHDPPSSILPALARSLIEQTSVAVTDDENRLIGEISHQTIWCCDETVIAAMATLSAGDLMAYMDCANPPRELVRAVKARLEERNLGAVIELLEEDGISSVSSLSSSCSSSDEEFGLRKRAGSARVSNKKVRRLEVIACSPRSSLVAVIMQALSHRVNYVWVVEDDHTLAGIVTFAGILKIFREDVRAMGCKLDFFS